MNKEQWRALYRSARWNWRPGAFVGKQAWVRGPDWNPPFNHEFGTKLWFQEVDARAYAGARAIYRDAFTGDRIGAINPRYRNRRKQP